MKLLDKILGLFNRKAVIDKLFPLNYPPAAQQKENLKAVDDCRQPEGFYVFDLSIVDAGGGALKARVPRLMTPNVLFAGPLLHAQPLAWGVVDMTKYRFGLDGQAHFRRKSDGMMVNGQDDYTGLPPGDDYQVIFVPKKCAWKPVLPKAHKKPANTCVITKSPV